MNAKWDDPRQPTANQVHSYLPPGQRMTTVQENIAFQQACKEWGEAMLPHLHPGALVMMFGGPRMFAWLSTGMQMAGFEQWDTFCWLHGEGFPKAMDIGKQVAKLTGEQPIAEIPNPAYEFMRNSGQTSTGWVGQIPKTKQIYANEWQGYKTPALKPAWEAILCFRAPRRGMTYAELALKFGTGCLNIDGGRIGTETISIHNALAGSFAGGELGRGGDTNSYQEDTGRYPANLILDEESAAMLGPDVARFFYCPKASKRERNVGCEDLPNDHPTVKPLALTRWLAALLLPPPSVGPRRLLVPFLGSGSEMIGAMQAGWDEIVGVEQDAHYCEIAKRRLEYWRMASVSHDVLPLSSPGRTDAA
jgi:site-specific DNA-methyltransferase (adenine-specific)